MYFLSRTQRVSCHLTPRRMLCLLVGSQCSPCCSPWLKLGEEVKEALRQGCQASKSSHLAHASCSHAASWKAANGRNASRSLAHASPPCSPWLKLGEEVELGGLAPRVPSLKEFPKLQPWTAPWRRMGGVRTQGVGSAQGVRAPRPPQE